MTGKVTLVEMAALAGEDLDDALSMKLARTTWGRPNSETEDREIAVRRALLELVNLIATYPSEVRGALKGARAKHDFPPRE